MSTCTYKRDLEACKQLQGLAIDHDGNMWSLQSCTCVHKSSNQDIVNTDMCTCINIHFH